MQTHSLFPTVVGEDFFGNNDYTKQLVLDTYFEKCNEDGYSNENTGHVDIHLDPRYESLYLQITNSINKYLANMAIMPGMYDVNVVKSWFNVTREADTPKHDHPEAHYSFVYYVNHPDDAAKSLVLHNDFPTANEPHGAFFSNNVFEWNHSNAYSWNLMPKEGTLYVFPAKLQHSTSGETESTATGNSQNRTKEDLLKKRISIAGDVVLTHREVSTKPTGLQPVSNWKTFR